MADKQTDSAAGYWWLLTAVTFSQNKFSFSFIFYFHFFALFIFLFLLPGSQPAVRGGAGVCDRWRTTVGMANMWPQTPSFPHASSWDIPRPSIHRALMTKHAKRKYKINRRTRKWILIQFGTVPIVIACQFELKIK